VRTVLRPPAGANGSLLLDTVVQTMLGLARANQYETFLQTPSAPEQSTATYVYATAHVPVAAPAAKPGGGGVPTALTVAAVLVALAAAAVAWAYL
jgi:hypothetical protein